MEDNNMIVSILGHVDKNNRGNLALLVTRIKVIDEFFENVKFIVFYRYSLNSVPENLNIYKAEGIGILSPFKIVRTIKTFYFLFLALIWRAIYDFFKKDFKNIICTNSSLRELYVSDIVITTGGDVLSNDYGVLSFIIEFYNLLIALILKKPVFIFAESIGPFKWYSYFIARRILNKAALITTRDEISFNYLEEIGVNKPPVYLTADSAFVLDKKRVNNPFLEEFLKRDNIIGFSISNAISEWGGGDYDDYAKLMVKIIDKLIEDHDANVLLVAHVTVEGLNDDRIINEKVFESVKNRDRVFNLKEDYNAEELKYVISRCDLFVGARMHANIAALSSCVPAVAISYSIKTPGLMKLCGIEDYYIEFEDLSEELLMGKISEAWENREKIREHLKKIMPKIKERAMKNGELVKEICDSLGIT